MQTQHCTRLFYILSLFQPPNTPKRPVPGEEEIEEPDETDYERQRKYRKLQKSRAAELERIEIERQIKLERERLETERKAKEEQQNAIAKLVEEIPEVCFIM